MWPTSRAVRRIVVLGIVGLCAALLVHQAPAQSIDLSLNVFYSNPINELSGGTWQVVAKSADSFGIFGLDLRLTGIVAPPQQPVGPRGVVNDADPAGFSEFDAFTNTLPSGVIGIILGQRPVTRTLQVGEEQSIFYGVGTVENGQPGDVGPALTTLTGPQEIPWATGDVFFEPEWNTAAILATGTFAPGQTPDFYNVGTTHNTGSVFVMEGMSTAIGMSLFIDSVSTTVRDNLGPPPDYNGNGIVDAADFTVWRDSLGQMGPDLAADGNRNGKVDEPDYTFWKLNFGLVVPGAGSASLGVPDPGLGLSFAANVPEPAAGTLLLGAVGILFLRRRFRVLRNVYFP